MTAMAERQPSTAAEFLGWLYGDSASGWLTLFAIDRSSGKRHVKWQPADRLDALADDAAALANRCCVWFGAATRSRQAETGRGKAEDCAAIPGLWVDIDVAGSNHASDLLPPTMAAARRLLDRFPLPPTVVIDSGGGLQAWWLFHEMMDAGAAAGLLARWGHTWQHNAEQLGWHVDNVWDLARVMRLPGTLNWKQALPALVLIETADLSRRYEPDDIDSLTLDVPVQTTPDQDRHGLPYIGPERPGDAYNATRSGADILAAAGFVLEHTDRNGDRHYTRPGKDPRQGSSATVYAEDAHTTIWSDTVALQWPGVAVRRPYDPFGLYTAMYHNGDYRKASEELYRAGFGARRDDGGWLIENTAEQYSHHRSGDEAADGTGPLGGAVSRAVDGATFLFDGGPEVAPLWGDGERCLWASGEGLLIVGPEGVGKTTLAQQLTLARAGIGEPGLLGFDVCPDARKVLYVAADRPSQARRSLLRMVGEDAREALRTRLVVWRGPLPFDLVKKPELLVMLAEHLDVGTIVLDSLKDVAMDLSKDETGARVNLAIQLALAEGIEIVGLHHQRKSQPDAPKPRTIFDVYGSRWLTAGQGSVFMLWGSPGDAVVELAHIKQPLEDVGPLMVEHDHHAGRSTVVDVVDVYGIVQESGKGITAQAIAVLLFKTVTPNRNQVEKARRRLDRLTREGRIHKQPGARGGGEERDPSLYFPLVEGLV